MRQRGPHLNYMHVSCTHSIHVVSAGDFAPAEYQTPLGRFRCPGDLLLRMFGSSFRGHHNMSTKPTAGQPSAESSSRSERINLRATREEVELLRQAATHAGLTLTTFIMSAALREAQSVTTRSN